MGVNGNKIALGLGLLLSLLIYQNCAPMKAATSGSFGNSLNANTSFQAVSTIVSSQCLSCHSTATSSNGNVALGTYDDIVLSGLVVPGNSESSLFYQVIEDGSMPPGRPLAESEMDVIKAWIDSGAADDSGTNANDPPIVDAGANQNITLPQALRLNGTATDVDGAILRTIWSQLSGPNSATISTPSMPTSDVSNLQSGTYVFELLAEDDLGAIAFDQVQIVVADSNNPPPTPDAITFTQLNDNIFSQRCLSCHNSANPRAGYDMSTYAGIMSAVTPGNPGISLLYTEVQSDSMPRGQTPLSNIQKQQIFDWIQAGAMNN